jgi:hypothetical protein
MLAGNQEEVQRFLLEIGGILIAFAAGLWMVLSAFLRSKKATHAK